MANSRNTLWCFGDSFTFGHSLLDRPGDDYYHNYPEKRVKRGLYTQLVADKFKLEIVNTATPGASNRMVIESIIDNLDKFKKGDRVVVGMTDSTRLETWQAHADGTMTRWPLNHYIHHRHEMFHGHFTKQQVIATRKYILEVVLPTAAYQEIHDYSIVKKLLKYTPVSNYYVWGPSEWKKYHTIFDDTKGKLKDYHFSWKGQQQIADDIVSKWETRKRYVCPIERIP